MKAQGTSPAEGKTDLNIAEKWSAQTPQLRSILRIVAGFLFIQFGTAKILAFPAAIMPNGGTAPIGSLVGVAGMLGWIGGFLLLLGFFTCPVAFFFVFVWV